MSKLNVKAIVVHCSASKWGDADVIRHWHSDPPPAGNGWADIGYHGVILNGFRTYGSGYVPELDGKIEPGREEDTVGAHCKAGGMNNCAIGVCLVGNPGWMSEEAAKDAANVAPFTLTPKLQYATTRQMGALFHFLAERCHKYGIDPLGTMVWQGRTIHCLSQHSDHDRAKPYCASLNMAAVRTAVHGLMVQRGYIENAVAPPPVPAKRAGRR